jgi:hypothetical protein
MVIPYRKKENNTMVDIGKRMIYAGITLATICLLIPVGTLSMVCGVAFGTMLVLIGVIFIIADSMGG